MTRQQMQTLGERWAEAERRADAGALDALLDEDFVGIGPLGFVLNREQWLDRHHPGSALRTEAFSWEDVAVHDHGAAAIAVGVVDQRASYQGQDSSGRFRVALTGVERANDWRLTSVQFSGPIPAMPPRQG